MPASESFAVLADIHGNAWALDAVLADLRRRSIRRVLNLGDCFYGPLDPAGVAERLTALEAAGVRGNQDRMLLEPPALNPPAGSTLEFVASSLSAPHRAWLAALPVTLRLAERIFLCHGSPGSDEEHLLEEVRPEGVFLRAPAALAGQVDGLDAGVVLCAHSHVPRTAWAAGRLVVNPGSVGLPAYTDDLPCPHVMEAGSPHARYALLSRLSPPGAGWQVEHVAVPYDWDAAAGAARSRGREDWAQWILTGRAHAA